MPNSSHHLQSSSDRRSWSLRVIASVAIALSSPLVYASPSLMGSGMGMTTGFVTNPHHLHSVNFNPAGIDFLLPKDKTRRMGLFGGVSGQYEIGNTQALKDAVDQVNTITKTTYSSFSALSADLAKLQNTLLPGLEAGGQLSLGISLSPPALPVVWRSEKLNGTLSFGLDTEVQIGAKYKTAEVKSTTTAITTNSGFDLRAVKLIRPALSYSTQPFHEFKAVTDPMGRLDVGGRLLLYSAQTMRDYKMVSSSDSTSISGLPSSSSNSFGLDLGVMNTRSNYQLGATLYNLISPKLKFPDIANNTAAVAQANAGKINLNTQTTLNPNLVLEASAYDVSKTYILQTSLALQTTTNLLGDERRFTTVSVGFNPRPTNAIIQFLTPQFRFGLRKNHVGSQLMTRSFGLSIFNGLSLDVWQSSQSSYIDANNNIPRTMGVSLAWVKTF